MRKTSVYLTDAESAALRRAARQRGRTQSELIREGVRHVTIRRSQQDQEESTDPVPSDGERPEWFSRPEHVATSLTNAKYTVAKIAQELHLSTEETLDILKSVERKKRFFANSRPSR